MQKSQTKNITIVGAGLSGAYLAVLLAKRGYNITIYEQRSKRDTLKTSERSINISFHNYGKNAFKKAGVWEEVRPDLVALKGSVTKLPYYRPILASFENLQLDYWSARREKLLAALIKKASSYANVTFAFTTEVVSIDRYEKTMLIKNVKTNRMKTVKTDAIVAADGVNSTVRSFLQRGQQTLHQQTHSEWEYKQVPFTAETAKKIPFFHADRAYSSTRKNAIFVALPNRDGTYSGMLAVSPENSFDKMPEDSDREAFIQKIFPELVNGIPEMLPSLRKFPKGNFVTMKTSPWNYKDFMVMVGDAGHAVTPFIGHGVTIGFGDCLTLVSFIDKYDGDFSQAFPAYNAERKRHVNVMVNMSIESFGNFQRERKAHYNIIFGAFESLLHSLFPRFIAPSIFERVVHNPDNAADYMDEHMKQRRRLGYVGIPLLVGLTTYAILAGEVLMQHLTPRTLSRPKSPTVSKKSVAVN